MSTGIATIVVQFGLATMPFGIDRSASALTSGTTSGHVGVHAPGRRVVDDGGAGRGDPRRERPRGGGAGREQGDVEPVVVGGVGVLDGELLVAEGERAARRAGRGEQPELVDAGTSAPARILRMTPPT